MGTGTPPENTERNRVRPIAISAPQQGPMMPAPMHFTLDYRQRS